MKINLLAIICKECKQNIKSFITIRLKGKLIVISPLNVCIEVYGNLITLITKNCMYKPRIAEKTVEQYLVWQITAAGGICKKYIQGQGFPDRIIIIKEYGFLAELKAPMGVLSELQKEVIAKLRKKGIRVEILWSTKQVDKLMKSLIDEGII